MLQDPESADLQKELQAERRRHEARGEMCGAWLSADRSAVPAGSLARLLLTYARLVEGGRLRKRRRENDRRWTEQKDGHTLSVGPPAYEDKKARERRQIEEADNALTEELMGGGTKKKVGLSSGPTGIAGIPLNTKAEHTSFGITISKKMADSTPQYIAAFYKALTDRLPAKMTGEVLDNMVAVIAQVRDEKKVMEGESAKALSKGKKSAAAKKEAKAKEKKQKEIFGGSDQLDEYYEAYGSLEDDFM